MAIPNLTAAGVLPPGRHPSDWRELRERFSGKQETQRRTVCRRLHWLRDRLQELNVQGQLLVSGSLVTAEPAPASVDVLLLADAQAAALRAVDEELLRLFDPQWAERLGYTLLYAPQEQQARQSLLGVWSTDHTGVACGVLELDL